MDSQELDEILWRHLSSLPYFRGFLRAIEDRFFQEITIEAPVLDLGSGDGHFAAAAFKEKLDVGMDPWVAPTLEARRRQAYRSLVLAEGGHIPFRSQSFNTVTSVSVMEHIQELEPVLEEVMRVLTPGKVCVLCSQSPFSPSPERAKIPDENRLTTSGQGLQSLFQPHCAPCAYGRSGNMERTADPGGFCT